jgi:glycerol-3-phosphate dehydrogenase
VARIEHLLGRYGSLISEVLDLIVADPSLARPLAGAEDYLRVEAVYAVTHEGARHLDDVMARRTHISIETWDRGLSAAEEVAGLMAGPMKWRHKQVTRELENYRASVAAARKSQEADTDLDADAIRLGAPDIVPVMQELPAEPAGEPRLAEPPADAPADAGPGDAGPADDTPDAECPVPGAN